jgi:hypothetical protein
MATREELLNRRIGRMEALASDLAGMKPGHNPTELELMRARELCAALARVFGTDIGPPQEEAPDSPDKKSPDKKPPGKK